MKTTISRVSLLVIALFAFSIVGWSQPVITNPSYEDSLNGWTGFLGAGRVIGMPMPDPALGIAVGDMDNDGDLDIFQASGW